jgi:hypothetical protein
MLRKLTMALGLALISSSLAFAAQAPATNTQQSAQTPAAAQGATSGSHQKQATTTKSTKKHKKHHKKVAPSNTTPKSGPSKP